MKLFKKNKKIVKLWLSRTQDKKDVFYGDKKQIEVRKEKW